MNITENKEVILTAEEFGDIYVWLLSGKPDPETMDRMMDVLTILEK